MKIIAGMHRSGTSIVTRLLFEAGADLGDPDTFYRPDKWNPDGYFEQPEFHAINRPLINGPFGRLSYFRVPSTETLNRRARRFADEIKAVSDKYRGKVVKEVRFCLTMPGWQQQGARFDRVLVCLREPYEVVRSVDRRFPVGHRRAYRLWRIHNERLLAHAKDLPLWFISFSHLRNPETRTREIRTALEFMEVPCSDEKLEYLVSLIKSPKHEADARAREEYAPEIATLWEDLQARHDAQFAPEKAAHVHG